MTRYFKEDKKDPGHHDDDDPKLRFSHDNKIIFGEGITYDRLWFQRDGDSLNVSILGTEDGLTIEDWYHHADDKKHRKQEKME